MDGIVTQLDIDQRIYDLYDEYCHGEIDRRTFLTRAAAVTVGGLAMAQALMPRYARAQTISFTDDRIVAHSSSRSFHESSAGTSSRETPTNQLRRLCPGRKALLQLHSTEPTQPRSSASRASRGPSTESSTDSAQPGCSPGSHSSERACSPAATASAVKTSDSFATAY